MNPQKRARRGKAGLPVISLLFLALMGLGCLLGPLFMGKDAATLNLAHPCVPPGRQFLLGTDTLGRDIFAMVWAGGRTSLLVGFAATALSTAMALVLGGASGLGPPWVEKLLGRFTEIVLSVPSPLAAVFLQALLGQPSLWGIALTVGATQWPAMAKVVGTEVRQLRGSAYVEAARCMGAGFFHILRRHLLPNVFPSILFMVVMNVRGAILAESTLSFMGLGLPVESVSWGGMLTLADQALLSGAWWILLVPGVCLAATLLSITEASHYLRGSLYRFHSNL